MDNRERNSFEGVIARLAIERNELLEENKKLKEENERLRAEARTAKLMLIYGTKY